MQPGPTGVPSNLPALPSRFVNREPETAALARLVVDSRLVTLTGPAGVGKTRLAVEVAQTAADGFRDGIWLVELASLRDPALVAGEVASVLSLTEQSGRDIAATLADHLGDREVLLVLDNCEHLVEDCATLADRLLRACPGLTVLATSQEPLGITGEQRWRLEPLAVPDLDTDHTPERLAEHAAVRLFVDRATSVDPDFALTAETAPAIAAICRSLDGIPLAVELAAARLDVLSPAELASRLQDRFGLLTGGSRTALPRHHTLQAALDWSHALLDDAERVLLRRLAVFAGSWDVGAAAEVCADDDLLPSGSVLDVLAALVAKSLVMARDVGQARRYSLLETTRLYARDRLVEAGEADTLAARHAAWCLQLVERAEAELERGDQQRWAARLEADHANVRAALAHLVEHGELALALRVATSSTLFWAMHGHYREGLRWLHTISADEDGPAALRARALWGAGWLAHGLGDYATVQACAEQSLDLAEDADAPAVRARALSLLGIAHAFGRNDPSTALSLLAESETQAREAGDRWCETGVSIAMGHAHLLRGDPAAARPCFERHLAAVGESGTDGHVGDTRRLHGLVGLGWAAMSTGDHATAQRSLTEAVEASRRLGHRFAEANAMRLLGDLAYVRGAYDDATRWLTDSSQLGRSIDAAIPTVDSLISLARVARVDGQPTEALGLLEAAGEVHERAGMQAKSAVWELERGETERALGNLEAAREHLDAALAAATQADNRRIVAGALSGLGDLARAEDDPERAVSLHHDALALRSETGDVAGVADSLEALAALAAADGDAIAAVRLFGAAQTLRDRSGLARPADRQAGYEADVTLARDALGAEEFDAAWRHGADRSMQEAVSYARRGRGPRTSGQRGWSSLTPAERDVADLAAQGLTNPEIGERLFISRRTVQWHLGNIYPKLGVTTRKQVASAAKREGRGIEGPEADEPLP